MKHEIKPLNVQLINQIAAGEVIEGPFSAVKELVENAIDAQATEIRVEIVNGGKSLIAVTDNGIGIPGDQIETAFLPHTTSKLRTIDDLQHIHTLGFRGEALASIAAVARIEVQTRAEDSLTGFKAIIENGVMQSLEETGCPEGTRIVVRDLFHQTPARLKFMKSDGAETSRITEMLTRLALSRRDISFQYINNNNIMLTTRNNTDKTQTAMSLFPADLAQGLMVVDEKTYRKGAYSITINGLIGQPHINRGNRNYQVFFVNGRSVRNEVLTHAYERAYEGAVMVRKFPVGIVYVSISPELLDVNVHPSKTTIKFQDPQWMEEAMLDYVEIGLKKTTQVVSAGGLGIGPTATELKLYEERKRLEKHRDDRQQADTTKGKCFDDQATVEQMNLDERIRQDHVYQETEKKISGLQQTIPWENSERNRETLHERNAETIKEELKKKETYRGFTSSEVLPGMVFEEASFDFQKEKAAETLGDIHEQPPVSGEHLSQRAFLHHVLKQRNYQIVGQAFKTYIILESGLSLYLIDQHAAHERVVYDQLLADVHKGSVEIQEIMDGQIIELSLAEMEWFRVHEGIFRQMGFVIEPFGHQAIRLTGVPYHLGIPAHHEFLRQLMDELMEQEWSGVALPMEKLIRKACRYAIKAHDKLSVSEMNALLEQMTHIQVPLTCPHGRPIVLQMRDYDLEKLFKRV